MLITVSCHIDAHITRWCESIACFLSYFPFGETKNFCSAIVTHFVVGDLCKNVMQFYLKFLIGVFNRTLSMYESTNLSQILTIWMLGTSSCFIPPFKFWSNLTYRQSLTIWNLALPGYWSHISPNVNVGIQSHYLITELVQYSGNVHVEWFAIWIPSYSGYSDPHCC